jgi:cobalt-zinc-cadmium efflux system membrane fusion protein
MPGLAKLLRKSSVSDHPEEIAPLPPARQISLSSQRRVVQLLVAGLVAIVLVLAVGQRLFRAPAGTGDTPSADSFRPTAAQLAGLRIVTVGRGANVELLRASGAITADADRSTPILLPFSGRVDAVMVEAGQRVARGQPLLSVTSPDLIEARNALLAARAQAVTAEQAASLARRNAVRQKAIFDTAGGAQKDWLQAEGDAVSAEGALRTARSAVAASQGKLALFGQAEAVRSIGRAVYRAPVSGVVVDRAVAPGQFITGNSATPQMTIADLSQVWLVAQLAESEATLVKPGDGVTVTTPALPGRSFTARIAVVGAALDPATHRLAVRATIANPQGLLKPQMFASFTIRRSLAGQSGVLVPATAVIHEGDAARVWTLERDGLLRARTVGVGETEGGMSRIFSGLAAGDRVVVSGALFVNEAGLDR